VTGQRYEAIGIDKGPGRTGILLDLPANGSMFVVFEGAAGVLARNVRTIRSSAAVVKTLRGPWTVRFDPKWGGPAEASFSSLVDWTTRPERGIRYYSGTASYEQAFDMPSVEGVFSLDLGTVHEIARVRLNGKDLGVVWTAPWSVDLGGALRKGANKLEIEVTNLWPNRIIGDAALPAEQRLTKTNVSFGTGDPLLPSGLLGPVRILRNVWSLPR
jgi:hypothetical protein